MNKKENGIVKGFYLATVPFLRYYRRDSIDPYKMSGGDNGADH